MKKAAILVFLLLAAFSCSSCFYSAEPILKNSPDASPRVSAQNEAHPAGSPSGKPADDQPKSSLGTLSELVKEGFTAIDEQAADFENWGVANFVTGTYADGGTDKLHFYLVDDNQNVLYNFPDFYGNQWSTFYTLRDVAIIDVNYDCLKDVIIIAEYMTGAGPTGAEPFPVASIYFQKDGEFVSIPDLDDKMNEKGENGSVDTVLDFTKELELNLN